VIRHALRDLGAAFELPRSPDPEVRRRAQLSDDPAVELVRQYLADKEADASRSAKTPEPTLPSGAPQQATEKL